MTASIAYWAFLSVLRNQSVLRTEKIKPERH